MVGEAEFKENLISKVKEHGYLLLILTKASDKVVVKDLSVKIA